MKFEAKEIVLNNGKTAILRNPTAEDAKGLIEYIKTASNETDFLIRYPEECDISTEDEADWICGNVESDCTLPICCCLDGEIAGHCEIEFRKMLKTKHRAAIGIGIIGKYWGLGIGSAMMNEMISAAEAGGIEIVELDFIEGNSRARHLYEKFGFRIVGQTPDMFRLKDGSYRTEYHMQKRLSKSSVPSAAPLSEPDSAGRGHKV